MLSQRKQFPYVLCDACADRLVSYSLRPREWYNLAAIHSPYEFYLHDDFYFDGGEAGQPKEEVLDAALHPSPTLADATDSVTELIDYCQTRHYLRPEELAAFAAFRPEDVLFELRRRSPLPINDVHVNLYATIAAAFPSPAAAAWYRELLERQPPDQRRDLLSAGFGVLSDSEWIDRALAGASLAPRAELVDWARVLSKARGDRVLDWLEQTIESPVSNTWGACAACMGADWPRLARWLKCGRPLSLVAVDALSAYLHVPLAPEIIIPHLMLSASVQSEMRDALTELQKSDSSPRVDAIAGRVLENLAQKKD